MAELESVVDVENGCVLAISSETNTDIEQVELSDIGTEEV